MFLIFNSSTSLKDDAYYVFQSAIELNDNNIRTFLPFDFFYDMNIGGYLYYNPHQLGFVTLERILILFSENPRFFFLLNFLIVIYTNKMIYNVVRLLTNNNKIACNYSILLTFLFFPQLFFILFIYGILISALLIISALYYFILFIKRNKIQHLAYHIILMSLAVILKQNNLIAMIAFDILFLLKWLESKQKIFIFVPLFYIFFNFILSVSITQFNTIGLTHISKGMPMSSYLVMGIRDENHVGRLGGWWDAYNIDVYTINKYNKTKLQQTIRNDLIKRLKELKANPIYSHKFFAQKVISMWEDPMFQSIWSGPMHKTNSKNYPNTIINDLGTSGPFYHVLDKFINIILFIIYFGAFAALFAKKHKSIFLLFFYLYFVGGFIFHLFWEAKSQYAFIYVLMLIPVVSIFLAETKMPHFFKLKQIYIFALVINVIKKSFIFLKKSISKKFMCYLSLIVLQISLCTFFAIKKDALYCDEVMSYGLANSENYAFLDKFTLRKTYDSGWATKDFFENYVTVDKNKPFSFKAAYKNQETDVHPPLYYILLHTASYFTDTFSKWPGLILNLIMLIFVDFAFFYISKFFFKEKIYALYPIILWSCSEVTLSSIIFIRMYVLLTLETLCYIAININLFKNNFKTSKKELILLFLCFVCGGLTHYFFYIFTFFFSTFYLLYALYIKKIKAILCYVSTVLFACETNLLLFPATLYHLLGTSVGIRTINPIVNNKVETHWFMNAVNGMHHLPKISFLAYGISVLLLAMIFFIDNYYNDNAKTFNENKKQKTFISLILLLSISCTMLMVMYISPFFSERYIYNLFPLLYLLLTLASYYVCINLNIPFKIYGIILIVLNLIQLNPENVDWTYDYFKNDLAKIRSIHGYDLLQYNNGWLKHDNTSYVTNSYTALDFKFNFDETYYFDEHDIPNLKKILNIRKSKNNVIISLTANVYLDEEKLNKIFNDIFNYTDFSQYEFLFEFLNTKYFILK